MDLFDSKKHIPWIVFEAKDWLDNYLDDTMNVFEWGTGGSTLYFSKKVKKIVAVEHNKKWYDEVSSVLQKSKMGNCEYFFEEPVKRPFLKYFPYNSLFCNSITFPEYQNFSFRRYVEKIDSYEDGLFDLVVVDGRARAACIKHALKKIKKGGFLMLDNSERESYKPAMEALRNFKRQDFFGKGPYLEDSWQTTVWQIN